MTSRLLPQTKNPSRIKSTFQEKEMLSREQTHSFKKSSPLKREVTEKMTGDEREATEKMTGDERDWLVGCFGFNGPLRQYFSLYRAVSQREGERVEKG